MPRRGQTAHGRVGTSVRSIKNWCTTVFVVRAASTGQLRLARRPTVPSDPGSNVADACGPDSGRGARLLARSARAKKRCQVARHPGRGRPAAGAIWCLRPDHRDDIRTRRRDQRCGRCPGRDRALDDSQPLPTYLAPDRSRRGDREPTVSLEQTSGSRYCPKCLAESGGRWQLQWRLAWTFACAKTVVCSPIAARGAPGLSVCAHFPRSCHRLLACATAMSTEPISVGSRAAALTSRPR